MIKNWFKIYIYHLFKNKFYFLLTVLSLAIGIASVVLSVLFYLEEHSYDQWNPYKSEVFVGSNKDKYTAFSAFPYALGHNLKEQCAELEDYMYFFGGYVDEKVEYGDKTFKIDKIFDGQKNFFSFFPFEFVYGSKASALLNPNDIAIELNTAELLFGKDVNPVGEQVVIEDKLYVVSGVYTLNGNRSSVQPDIVRDIYTQKALENDDWFSFYGNIFIKTKKPDAVKHVIDMLFLDNYYKPQAEATGVSVEKFIEENGRMEVLMNPLENVRTNTSVYFTTPEGTANMQMMHIMIGLSALILILSVFNYINLTLSQMLHRAKEVGIRKTIGATRQNIILQSLFESFITTLIAFVVSLTIVELILPFVNVFVNSNMAFSLSYFVPVLLPVFIGIVFLVGILPAVYIANYKVLKVLKGNFHRNKAGTAIKNTFLVLQFTIACFFIVSTLLVNKQVSYMLNKDLGFKGDQIINFSFLENSDYGEERLDKYYRFKEELLHVKGVEQVVAATSHFGIYGNPGVFTFCTYKDEKQLTGTVAMDYEYFDTHQIQIKHGRNISEGFSTDSIDNVVVNESFVRAVNESDILGKQIESGKNKYTVIGVVKDFNIKGLDQEVPPLLFAHHNVLSNSKGQFNYVSAKLDMDNFENTIKWIETVWDKWNIESKEPFKYEFTDKQFAKTFDKILLEKKVFSILNYIVLMVALFGLFAVSSFTIGTRLKEIAIRKVLGADTQSMLKKLSYQYMVYCVVGFVLSVFPSYYFLNQWLNNYAYRISIGWETYVYSFISIMVLVLGVVLSRAYSATRINILKYINYE